MHHINAKSWYHTQTNKIYSRKKSHVSTNQLWIVTLPSCHSSSTLFETWSTCAGGNCRRNRILPIWFIKGEMTRCVSAGCNKDDHPMERHLTLEFPWNIETIMAELDAEAQVSFKNVTTPRGTKDSGSILVVNSLDKVWVSTHQLWGLPIHSFWEEWSNMKWILISKYPKWTKIPTQLPRMISLAKNPLTHP